MPLTLRYTGETAVPVEIEGLIPSVVRDKTLAEIEKFEIFHGNRKLALAEMFHVSGDPGDLQMRFEGDLSGVHWIGAGLDGGTVRVAGFAGRHVGSEMTAGQVHVEGDAGDWVGAEMHGGLIHVRGRAGHVVGGAYRGSQRGMTRGTILIDGDVGDEAGHTMRRGTLVVGGDAGDAVGFNMLAGSIYVFGRCGIRPGAGMRRGTIGLFGADPPPLLPTFRRACRFQPAFLRFTLLELCRQGVMFADEVFDAHHTLFHGDFLEGGRGEIILRET